MSANFKFINFEPENDLKTFSKEIYWLVEERAPSRAAKVASCEFGKSGFISRIKIVCTSGTFEAQSQAVDARESIDIAYKKIKGVLKTWSDNRLPELTEEAPA